MSTNIYCHWDGYPSWNGIILHECYSDIGKVKELVDRPGYISTLGPKVCNTVFAGSATLAGSAFEPLDDFKKNALDYYYLFDSETGGWSVFYRGIEAKMADIVSDVAAFKMWEPGGGDESFSRMQAFRDLLNNGYQCWREPANGGYLDSYFVPDKSAVVVIDGYSGKEHFGIHCSSLGEANEISDRIYGRPLEDIINEFVPSIKIVLADATERAGDAARAAGKEMEIE